LLVGFPELEADNLLLDRNFFSNRYILKESFSKQVDIRPASMYTDVPYTTSLVRETEGLTMASVYRSAPAGTTDGPHAEPPRLLDRLRFALRTKHYALATEKSYRHWMVEYLRFHRSGDQWRHPTEKRFSMPSPSPSCRRAVVAHLSSLAFLPHRIVRSAGYRNKPLEIGRTV